MLKRVEVAWLETSLVSSILALLLSRVKWSAFVLVCIFGRHKLLCLDLKLAGLIKSVILSGVKLAVGAVRLVVSELSKLPVITLVHLVFLLAMLLLRLLILVFVLLFLVAVLIIFRATFFFALLSISENRLDQWCYLGLLSSRRSSQKSQVRGLT